MIAIEAHTDAERGAIAAVLLPQNYALVARVLLTDIDQAAGPSPCSCPVEHAARDPQVVARAARPAKR